MLENLITLSKIQFASLLSYKTHEQNKNKKHSPRFLGRSVNFPQLPKLGTESYGNEIFMVIKYFMILSTPRGPSSKHVPKTSDQVNGSVNFPQLPKLGTESHGSGFFMVI